MNTQHELFGELHEQDENGSFGNEHGRQYEAKTMKITWQGDDSEVKAEYKGLTLKVHHIEDRLVRFMAEKNNMHIFYGFYMGDIKTAMDMAELAAREHAG